jgi:TRAP-type C4-dicarboxylate transport system permease small subunit
MILVVLGVSATVIMFANAVGRYVFNTSFVWAEELIRILFVWGMFIAITDSFINNEHIGFRNFAELNAITRFVADLIYSVSLTIVGGVLSYYGWKYNAMTGDVPLSGTNLPAAVLMLPGIVAGAVWCLFGAIRTVRILGKGRAA